jgi:hypothetical protein
MRWRLVLGAFAVAVALLGCGANPTPSAFPESALPEPCVDVVATQPGIGAEQPPEARLEAGGDVIAAAWRVGRWGRSDGPSTTTPEVDWMPEVEATSTETFRLMLDRGIAFDEWGAVVSPAETWNDGDVDGAISLARGADAEDPLVVMCASAPPVGDWVLSVKLTYSEDRGFGYYYWHLRVD